MNFRPGCQKVVHAGGRQWLFRAPCRASTAVTCFRRGPRDEALVALSPAGGPLSKATQTGHGFSSTVKNIAPPTIGAAYVAIMSPGGVTSASGEKAPSICELEKIR